MHMKNIATYTQYKNGFLYLKTGGVLPDNYLCGTRFFHSYREEVFSW